LVTHVAVVCDCVGGVDLATVTVAAIVVVAAESGVDAGVVLVVVTVIAERVFLTATSTADAAAVVAPSVIKMWYSRWTANRGQSWDKAQLALMSLLDIWLLLHSQYGVVDAPFAHLLVDYLQLWISKLFV
jgi:hypothetical protein